MNKNPVTRDPEGFKITRIILASASAGLLFGAMDGVINGNPYAAKLMACYKPILRDHINMPMGVVIDLIYGFIITCIFWVINPSLPGKSRTSKGLAYGLGMWFFRVVMGVLSSWMMFTIPNSTLLYILLTGLPEMLILGFMISWIIKR